MIAPKDFFKAKDLPKWMTSHPLFKEVKGISKVFPGLGLPNTSEEREVDNGGKATAAAKSLIAAIQQETTKRKTALLKFKDERPSMSEKRALQLNNLVEILNTIIELAKNPDAMLTKTKNGKLTLNLPSDITPTNSNKPLFKKGEGLLRVYGKLNELLHEGKFVALKKIEDKPAFKQFSTDNIPASKFKVVFSSDGADGLWDIATMSMRGVQSCQSWNGQYHKCIIGSVLDPFVGIIYLTSGGKFNKYGTKMIKRCIVRFAIHETDKQPYLILDNMYPNYDAGVADTFIKFLKEKTGGKIEVAYAQTAYNQLHKVYIPLTDLRRKLGNIDERSQDDVEDAIDAQYGGDVASYQDHHIRSKKSEKADKQALLFEKNAKKKTSNFMKTFTKAFTEVIKNVDVEQLPEAVKPAISRLAGKSKANNQGNWDYSYVLHAMAQMLAKDIIDSVDKKDFNNSDTYIRRIYYAYLMRRNEILGEIKTKLVRELNGKLGLKKKMKGDQLITALQKLLPKVDEIMKAKLKELANKRKEKFSGAAPLP